MIFDELDSIVTTKTKIKVIGVGGAGKNAIDHMIENEVKCVEFYAVNTDAQDLKMSKAPNKLLIGRTKTHGQGAGANPEVGRAAALESEDDIHEMIGDAEMVFVTCGMGGGTGTGAAPIIARVAREHGCLTVGVCTKPFQFEGPVRMNNAIAGLEELRQYVDTLIVIPNQRLLQIIDQTTPVLEAYREADNVLRKGVQGISEIIALPANQNVDFADVRTVMANKGTALLGIGAATGPNRAIEAARLAIHSSLLEVSIDGATDAIVNITASTDLGLKEIENAVNEIRNNCDKDLNVIYGWAINKDLGDEMVVTVVATGYELKARESGYGDIADEIFRHMSDENIDIKKISVNDIDDDDEADKPDYITSESENKQNAIFGYDKRETKRIEKEEKKAAKKAAKEEKRAIKKSGYSSSSSSLDDDASIPSWLKK